MANQGSILGNSVLRKEDPGLLTGKNLYTDDMKPANLGHIVFVRSSVAHARITSVDVSAAKSMPGVLGVYMIVAPRASLSRCIIANGKNKIHLRCIGKGELIPAL